MARRRKRRKGPLTAHQRLFGAAARQCHKDTDSAPSYGKCVSRILESGRLSAGAARPARKKRRRR